MTHREDRTSFAPRVAARLTRHLRLVARALSLTAAVASAPACDDEQSLDGLVDDYINEWNTQISTICDCHRDWELESRSDCERLIEQESGLAYLGPSSRRCLVDAYGRDESASRQHLECIVPLEAEYADCLDKRLMCMDASHAFDVCGSDYDVGRNRCIELPTTVARAVSECF